jgi:hypothetical protein
VGVRGIYGNLRPSEQGGNESCGGGGGGMA